MLRENHGHQGKLTRITLQSSRVNIETVTFSVKQGSQRFTREDRSLTRQISEEYHYNENIPDSVDNHAYLE